MLLAEPRDGVPEPITTGDALARYCRRLAGGSGPVALDAERASGYRYGQRAYLVQVRRRGAGTAVIDPTAFADLTVLDDAIGDVEWVLHAASQDLPCLAEARLRPRRLFDTELASRLLGYPRVGLATMLEQTLGITLAKGHSAADWSTRPLPHDWLAYAALDVELLVELRGILASELDEAGKLEWAEQEFAHLAAGSDPAPRTDPWRRTSGIHAVHGRSSLAVVRSLWSARDDLARRRDRAPGRILPDRAIIDAARAMPRSRAELARLPHFRRDRETGTWWHAVAAAHALTDAELPDSTRPVDGPPPVNRWRDREPAAAARLAAARAGLAELSERIAVPVENIVVPDAVRRLAWEPPDPLDEESVRARLAARSARAWQLDLAAPLLTAALAATAPAPGVGG